MFTDEGIKQICYMTQWHIISLKKRKKKKTLPFSTIWPKPGGYYAKWNSSCKMTSTVWVYLNAMSTTVNHIKAGKMVVTRTCAESEKEFWESASVKFLRYEWLAQSSKRQAFRSEGRSCALQCSTWCNTERMHTLCKNLESPCGWQKRCISSLPSKQFCRARSF